MSQTFLKAYQERAVASGVTVFAACQEQLAVAGADAAQRAAVVAHNGVLLLEAPTGAGKTLMAGSIAETVSGRDEVVWFWFAPFAGLVEQTRGYLRHQFRGLGPRDLATDRHARHARSGQVFVTTWASVAARNREARKVRTNSELTPSVDEFVPALRARGFKIGVVVDEAHHGFHEQTQAAAFFRDVLRPEYTMLVTATPDDADIRRFKQDMGVAELHRLAVSRQDAVDAGLIKQGIKSVAYFADPGQEALVDFERTALRDGRRVHEEIKRALAKAGIALTPLLLVQVDSREKSVERAKEKLLALGFTEGQIAVHTANEPDPDLLALAHDETREVLIFKLAVALGFDALRAFTLVSMRGARDADFGVQIVGRILRVPRKLQGRAEALPELLRHGYVLLADADAQAGLTSAAERINRLRTELASVSPFTAVVRLGGQTMIQVTERGQTALFPPGEATPEGAPRSGPGNDADFAQSFLFPEAATPVPAGTARPADAAGPAAAGLVVRSRHQYSRRFPVPKCFQREVLPAQFDDVERMTAEQFALSASQLIDAMRETVVVKKQTLELFTRQLELGLADAQLSREEVARRALKLLWKSEVFDARELRRALRRRLADEFQAKGLASLADHPEELDHALNMILVQNPRRLVEAQKAALARHTELESTGELPEAMRSETPLDPSLKNLYGIMPPGLNRWERNFALLLDRDLRGAVRWWHRNEPFQDWAVQVIRPDGYRYFPDFILCVAERRHTDGIALVETKAQIEDSEAEQKVNSEHRAYGRPLMVHWENEHRWMTVAYDPQRGRTRLDRVFDPGLLAAA
jgi:superfamily II DNA or RNA helicase